MQPSKRLGLWRGCHQKKKKKKRQSLAIADKVKLQSYSISLTLITRYFKNLIIRLHVLYALKTQVKFCTNWILFIIWFIRLYFMHNFKLQKLAI